MKNHPQPFIFNYLLDLGFFIKFPPFNLPDNFSQLVNPRWVGFASDALKKIDWFYTFG